MLDRKLLELDQIISEIANGCFTIPPKEDIWSQLLKLYSKKKRIQKDWQDNNREYSNEKMVTSIYELKDIDRQMNKLFDLLIEEKS